ncbi:hypothetical protein [Streptomyces sp. CBMA123]|uniref:hypothetical protein n=1 Tax=Streptomyces sp. CBMA123 TaxID=1896313 RepID=UPI0016620E0C|nr:hypothetical protein [Streptomyces sp. CBMA123]MBD0695991.1 hypothetical protein [Streptomyces sp. CBMA123]
MNLRTKKTLTALLRGALVIGACTLYGHVRGGHFAVTPLFLGFIALNLATVGYTWWWYGDSPKAVEFRAKAEAKKAAANLSH